MQFTEHSWAVPAHPLALGVLRRHVSRVVGDHHLDEGQAADVVLAVSEAASNAVRHGYPHRDPGTIRLRVDVRYWGVRVVLCDDGVGLLSRSEDPGAGLGTEIMRAVSDELIQLSPAGGGAQVEMVFRTRTPAIKLI